jgi:large subunit ribosomal protein L24
MSSKIHIKKGDNIVVITGDSKGKQVRRVLSVDVEKERAIVEGANLVSKHTKPNAKSPQGGIVKKEAPIHVSNLMRVDASGKPSRKAKTIKK